MKYSTLYLFWQRKIRRLPVSESFKWSWSNNILEHRRNIGHMIGTRTMLLLLRCHKHTVADKLHCTTQSNIFYFEFWSEISNSERDQSYLLFGKTSISTMQYITSLCSSWLHVSGNICITNISMNYYIWFMQVVRVFLKLQQHGWGIKAL